MLNDSHYQCCAHNCPICNLDSALRSQIDEDLMQHRIIKNRPERRRLGLRFDDLVEKYHIRKASLHRHSENLPLFNHRRRKKFDPKTRAIVIWPSGVHSIAGTTTMIDESELLPSDSILRIVLEDPAKPSPLVRIESVFDSVLDWMRPKAKSKPHAPLPPAPDSP